ncbi:MFS transporter [Siculibacillus lacustris]|uniref:MFS transporter n=2 Tax=Siculibacillus lacustris TaxID=1549641 RepID=A0A4Q9VRM5_9HYPH|nr:MFS transporter [Siculibacillus lacustris]
MLNDTMQSLVAAIYPILKDGFALDFGQIGLITLCFQMTASILQPLVGIWTDRHPQPFSLAVGMGSTLTGLLLLSVAPSYGWVLFAVGMIGTGSAVFHPEASRTARLASGGHHGLAQSLFQVGGNGGSALGPLLAAFVVLPNGRGAVAWFSGVALVGMAILTRVGVWAREKRKARGAAGAAATASPLPRAVVIRSIAVLMILVFSKNVYLASISSYYTFYLIDTFGVGVREAQLYLFVFLGAAAVGTLIGGPVGDRIGRKAVIWVSILGVLPFSLALPYVGLTATAILSVLIGLILSSAFSAILVFAQELVPGRVGMIAGLFFGLAFGFGGLGAAALGELADHTSIRFVYEVCAFLPAFGLLTVFLPNLRSARV